MPPEPLPPPPPPIGPPSDPPGSGAIARWAALRGMRYECRPDQAWFRAWEPYDTMACPSYYLNACSWPANPGIVVLAEPWTEEGDLDPMERTILGFAAHPDLRYRAAMRVGENFLTRVSFLSDPPAPIVQIGVPDWDAHVVTRALSPEQGRAAFHGELRALLHGWGFRGHIELRVGGAVVHYADRTPTPEHFEKMAAIVPQIVSSALRYRR